MKIFKTFCIFTFLLVSFSVVDAASTKCPQHYVNGVSPIFNNESLKKNTQEICYSYFGLMHSGIKKTSFWSAEHLTKANLLEAKTLIRENPFHPDENIPKKYRAELTDYQGSGWDRGHLAPNGNMPNKQAQFESFSLSNIIPQNAKNNRNIWKNIESAVRNMAIRQGELYTITGPLYLTNNGKLKKKGFIAGFFSMVSDNMDIPSHVFKIVYNPARQEGAVYVVKNEDTTEYAVVSILDLEKKAGINFLPSLPDSIKNQVMELPVPRDTGYRGKTK